MQKRVRGQINSSMAINKLVRGLTLAEMIIAMAIMVIIMAAIMPQFRAIRNSWASSEASANMIQNGRVLQEHINRNLSAAKRIVRVSSSSIANGFIIFKDSNDIEKRYMVSGGYVVFGNLGSEEQLAGPVSKFQVSSYSLDDFDNATTDANSIRLVEVETVFTNSNPMGTDRTFLTSAYLRTNTNAACDMIAHWKLDDGSGTTAADSSGNGNNGTLVNWPSWTTGIIDGGLEFDGWNDYVNCGSDSSLDITGDITIALWLRADNFWWEPDIITKGSYSSAYSVWLTSSGNVRFSLNNDRLTSNTALSTGEWHHIAMTREGSARKIYIDGREDASDTYGTAIGTTGWPLTISTTSYPFNGTIDDVRLYDRALSADEVEQLATTLRYMGFNEAKTSSDTTSLPIPTGTSAGDLLIAAIAMDGDTSSSAAAPAGQGWTLINRGDYNGEVTLAVWWKNAGDSEPASHQFNWSGNRQAYGWMMRFTGQDSTNPINASATANDSDSTPTSPAVTTTVDNCIILRLGAFDNSDITEDSPGLSGHTAITMDKSSQVLFWDDFELSLAKWTTDWNKTPWQAYTGNHSVHCGSSQNDLISDNINTSGLNSFRIEFWYRIDDIDGSDNVYLQFYDGGSYDYIDEIGDDPENTWLKYDDTINNSGGGAQYFRSNFQIKIEGSSIDGGENLWVDDVVISAGGVSGGAGYVKQSTAGSSGTSNFSLGSSNEARMLTIAIAPDSTSIDDCGEIRP